MLESMQQDYVRVARAKGLKESTIVAAPRAAERAHSGVTLGGLAYAQLLTGAS